MAKKDEWVTLEVKIKRTDHNIAPGLLDDIQKLLDKHGLRHRELTFFWGDEPRQSAASTGLRK